MLFDGLTSLLNTGLPPLGGVIKAHTFDAGTTATLDILVPRGAGPFPVLVYLHGGAWVAGSPATHRKLTARFAEAGQLVVSVDYRLAPEHPFPAGLDDCVAAVEWVAGHITQYQGDPTRIAIGGDSAGANLAAATAIQLRRRLRGPEIRAALLIYGVFDMQDMGNAGVNEQLHQAYLPGERAALLQDPRISPIHGAADLPPSFVVVGRQDPLLGQSRRLRDALGSAGVPVVYLEEPGMPHGFMQMEFTGAVRRIVRDMSAFLGAEQQAPDRRGARWRRLQETFRRWRPTGRAA
jgi:acetyl esterase